MVTGMRTDGRVEEEEGGGRGREGGGKACLSHESPDTTWVYCLQVF